MNKKDYDPQPYAEFIIDDIFLFLKQFSYIFDIKYFLYRGHADANWALTSSYDRYKEKNISKWPDPRYFNAQCDSFLFKGELAAINNFRAANKISYDTRHPKLEALSEMQHYGAVTRLLDVSESFGIALFFAIADNYDHEEAAIWAINRNFLNSWPALKPEQFAPPIDRDPNKYFIFNPRAETTLSFGSEFLFESFSYVETSMNEHLCDFAEEIIGNKKVTSPPNKLSYSSVSPGVFPVRPSTFNNRILAQNGFFLFQQSLELSFMDNLLGILSLMLKISKIDFENYVNSADHPKISATDAVKVALNSYLIKFIIPHSIFKDCYSVLSSMNINYASLFPDKVGLAKNSIRKYFSK